jgi:hypothetical protein
VKGTKSVSLGTSQGARGRCRALSKHTKTGARGVGAAFGRFLNICATRQLDPR